MKKYLYSVIVAVLCLLSANAFANVITGEAAIPDGYYNKVNSLQSPDNILTALNSIIKGHTVIPYKGLEPYYEQTDFYADTLWDMYSTCRFDMSDANKQQKAVCDGWNKEHVCCQSWLGSGPMVSDLFNVYPTDARVNNLRSNYPYGVVASAKGFSNDPHNHALGKLGSSAISGGGDIVYEPDDRYKGDFARTFFYMVARYRENVLNDGNGTKMFTSKPTNFTSYALSFLLKWHREDPVSEKEIDRNQAVFGIQHNRNPFIDYPELVEYIWGEKKGQKIDLASLTPTSSAVAPPVDVIDDDGKYGVTWYTTEGVLRIDSVEPNMRPDSIPDAPTSCSQTSESFVGWSRTAITGTTDMAPDNLYLKLEDFPAVTSDVTYFAVFAHETEELGEGADKETATFDGYKRGNKISSVTAGAFTITFAQGAAATETTYFTEARCYAGSTITISGPVMTKVEFVAGMNDKSNALTPSVGTMADNATWKGSAETVTFTVGGDSGYRGIKAIDIIFGEQSIVTTYRLYLTSCEDEPGDPGDPGDPGEPGNQGIEQIGSSADPQPVKFIRNAQLYILCGEHIYDTQGKRVQ